MLSKFKNQLKDKGEVYLRIKVRPGASANKIKEVMADDTVKIDIAAAPVRGRANSELVGFLSDEFSVPAGNVIILSGAGDKIKLVKIKN
ncbi:MAG: DUF167 domain-containing protein [Candidatus Falkowbacteria bacterium]